MGLGVLACAAGSARAQATAETAAKLKAAFEAWMPSGENLAPAESEYLMSRLGFQSIGSWRVEPDGDGYRITMPGIRTQIFDGFGQDRFRFFIICDPDQMRATPGEGGRYVLTGDAALNCRFQVPGATPSPITARRRQTSGSVDLRDPAVIEVSTTLDQMKMGDDGAATQLRIERLTLAGNRRAVADGRSDLRSTFVLKGVSLQLKDGFGPLNADKIVYEVGVEAIDMPAMTNAATVLAKRFGSGTASADAAGDPAIRALQDAYADGLPTRSHMTVTANGLGAATPAATVTIDSLAFGGAELDAATDSGRFTGRLDGQGIKIQPPPRYAEWIPVEGSVQISMSDLPMRSIAARRLLPNGGSEAQGFGPPSSGFTVHYDAFRLTAPQGALDLKGTTALDPDALRKMTAALQLRLTGIDGLVKALQADPKASQAAAGLTMLQVLGRQTTTPDGKSARDYEIVIDPSGQILVNGADVQALVPKDL
ncbi:hypothetical protein P409_28130 [Inquilinus limosus MP06]|uniref:DUF945 domain-containing protein n=1 Tax=Inquilinus limosus MP06 TaxID=1398085 RepID=A0A0A0D2K6_9PROT|nr:hypothetical protein P409_28130 [Inquilinus limosus MP06]